MKKPLIIILSVVIIIILGVVGYFVWDSLNNEPIIDIIPSGEDVVEDEGLAAKAIVETLEIVDNATGSNRLIDAKYPSVLSFKNKDLQNSVNKQIREVILAYRDEILVMIDEETPSTALYTYKTTYEKLANGDYLSLVISNDYQTGGIRSNKWKDIYNIDVRNERIFKLEDIFPANVDYKDEILYQIELQAENNNYTLMNGAGLKDLQDNQKFYIDDGKLIIYFDPAEIAPATYGILQFEMPFTLGEDGLFRI